MRNTTKNATRRASATPAPRPSAPYGVERAAAPAGAPRRRLSLVALVLTGAAVTALTTACDVRDNMCMSNEYPVAAVGSTLGGACVTNGDRPPAGYVRYPKGKVPQHVGDKWDTYWGNHALDAQGNVIPG